MIKHSIVLILQLTVLYGQQSNLFLDIFERTNTILFHLNETIEDVNDFLPSYDFIIVGSGSGGNFDFESRLNEFSDFFFGF